MTKVALRAYNREIESMIEQGQRLDEAVAHCRHILATYPKHLDTYRLLGKAYLESKRHDQAVDVFQRVLVAAPEDFVSHVGMSIIADEQGRLDEAIWHMERAFEVQPSNAAIQAELQRLFGRRDGVEPPKIRMTRGALAHMYVQGELYAQAISEARAVLANDPQRMDMQVLLARAYFRNGQKAEAADVCAALLGISPYCLDANRLLAEILPGTQATEAAQEYRRRVLEMDPYAEFAGASIFATDSVADSVVTLPRLEYNGQAPEAEAGIFRGQIPGMKAEETAQTAPNWISSNSDSDVQSESSADEDLPDFLRGSGWREVPADSDGVDLAGGTEADSVSEVEPGELPEWVRALAPNEDQEPSPAPNEPGQTAEIQSMAGSVSLGYRTEPEPQSVQDTPDWLNDLATSADAAPNAAASSANETPATRTPESGPTATASAASDDGLAWLEGLAEKHGAKPEELITPQDTRPDNPPDWLDQLRRDETAVPEGWEPINEEPAEFRLSETSPAEGPAEAPARSSMDWLSGLADSNVFAEMEKPSEADRVPLEEESAADSSLPAWLDDVSSRAAPPTPAAAPESAGTQQPSADLPDWLADLDRTSKAPAAGPALQESEPQVPDWLQSTPEQPAQDEPDLQWRPVHAGPLPVETSAAPLPEATAFQAGPITTAPSPEQKALLPRTRSAQANFGDDGPSLGAARNELGRGNIAAGLEIYGRLIRRGKFLSEIIRELRDALYRYPVEVPIWQALGDAYMRANRLQEALDAYTKAEELLR